MRLGVRILADNTRWVFFHITYKKNLLHNVQQCVTISAPEVQVKLSPSEVAADLSGGHLSGQLVKVQVRGLRILAAAFERRNL